MTTVSRALRAREPRTNYADTNQESRRFLRQAGTTLFASVLAVGFVLPLVFMIVTSLKTEQQIAAQSILPQSPTTVVLSAGPFAGGEFEVFAVPLPSGELRSLALVRPGREASTFIDPRDPTTAIEWDGRWRALEPVVVLDPTFSNFGEAWSALDFLIVLRNTGVIAGLGMAATLISSTLVAYGLTRFRVPGKRLILASLLATIIMPGFVTIVPTYAIWLHLDLVGTWWPLIVPHLFGSAFNVFILRQFFLSISRDLDEAAMMDGASPLYTLLTVIVPQAKGPLIAVSLFHFLFAWNDFFGPLVYLAGVRDRQPISVALFEFFGLFDTAIPLVQAGALLSMAIPIAVFLSAQRVFLRSHGHLVGALK